MISTLANTFWSFAGCQPTVPSYFSLTHHVTDRSNLRFPKDVVNSLSTRWRQHQRCDGSSFECTLSAASQRRSSGWSSLLHQFMVFLLFKQVKRRCAVVLQQWQVQLFPYLYVWIQKYVQLSQTLMLFCVANLKAHFYFGQCLVSFACNFPTISGLSSRATMQMTE